VTLRLKRGRPVSGLVLDHEGKPVAGASVYAAKRAGLNLHDGKAWDWNGKIDPAAEPLTTDESGRFTELRLNGINRVFVSTPLLDAWLVELNDGQTELTITLPQPATVVVNYDIPGASGELGVFHFHSVNGKRWHYSLPHRSFKIGKGRTVLNTLTPGNYRFHRRKLIDMGPVGRYAMNEVRYFEVKPGATHTVNWTRPNGGAVVKARITWPRETDVGGIMYTFRGTPVKDFGNLNDPNQLDAGSIDLKNGKLQSAVLAPGKYTMEISVQLPVTEERQNISSPITPDYIRQIEVTIPEDTNEVILDDIDLPITPRG
jgi:hypothetical protein